MNPILVALLLLPLVQGPAGGGADQPGKVMWEAFENDCKLCHGVHGEGGLGPDLAGHSLTQAQFLRAVRKPWGIMPAFVADRNLSDQQVGQIAAYLASLPKVAEPSGTWFTAIPALSTPNQRLMISMGCGQCHGQLMANPRRTAGAAGADYAWFKKEVYEHTSAPGHVNAAHLRMGNYSPMRVPEPVLQQLWQFFAFEQGLRVPVNAAVSAGVPSAKGVTYTLTVSNTGAVGKGLVAEYVTVILPLPTGAIPQQATVQITTTGGDFAGVRRDNFTNTDAAAWEIPYLPPGAKRTYTFTLSGPGAASGIPRGMATWALPKLGSGGTDQTAVSIPRAQQ